MLCTAKPTLEGSGTLSPIKNVYQQSDKLSLTCSNGFESEGANESVCTDGQFVPSKLTCKGINDS